MKPRRHVLITGAGSGIGRALAEHLASEGHRLVLVGRRRAPLEETAAAAAERGGEAFVVPADVSDEGAVSGLAELLTNELGSLDALANVAGLAHFGTIEETGPEAWRRVLEVNLTAPYLVSRALLPLLRNGDAPAIVHVASTLAQAGLRRGAAYCAAKAGLVNLTRAMALDHADEGIRVNVVCPGVVDTPMIDVDRGDERASAERRALLAGLHPLGRLARPEEIAVVIAQLLGPESSFVTGSVVNVDGGLMAGFQN